MNTNQVKAQQLGMPLGTASNRLRKMVLFDLLVRHGENVCCRCGREITRADDLTLDHKKPWLHASADLFWDLGNIAFAHPVCNNRAGRKRLATKCSRCGTPGRREGSDGKNRECRQCNTEMKRVWRARTGRN